MNKTEILKVIKQEIPSVVFPSNIDFQIEDTILYVTVDSRGVRNNMQDNSSAFEGWIFCIMNAIKNISEVILRWENPLYSNSKDLNIKRRQQRHYNRFLLRVIWFTDNYEWLKIEKNREDEIDKFRKKYSFLVINYPTTSSKDKNEVEEGDSKSKFEAILETQLYHKLNEILPNSANHQLPVGIFNNIKSTETAITPHGASQIDLWQLENDVFRIFELKDTENTQNKRVGIISELMFYANVFNNIFLTKKIHYPEEIFHKRKYYRGFDLIVNALVKGKVKEIDAVFLSEELHPLINSEIFKALNNGKSKIRYSYLKVSELMKK